jgi:putative SOS response-associated peptidase YedK
MAAVGRLRRFGRGPVNVGSWHVRDVTPAATRAAAIKGGAAIPARSPFMLRPRCRTLRALSCSDPSEGRRFPKGRCLIPASHFFEFTGTKSPKSKWKFTKAGDDWFCFAGLWRPMPDRAGEAFTLLTTDPGLDVAPIHNRQMVVLDRSDWLAWLDLTTPESELLHPLPAGSLAVEQVR